MRLYYICLLLISCVTCSENVDLSVDVKDSSMTSSIEGLEKPKLIRQQNTPRSQRRLLDYCKEKAEERGIEAIEPASVTLKEAWRSYKEDGGDLLMCLMESEGFDPNGFTDERDTILISAIRKGDTDLVKRLLKYPELDVNFPGLSGSLPLEFALDHQMIFNAILGESHDLDILRKNYSGENTIQRAIKEGLFNFADRLLKEVRLNWMNLSEEQREELVAVQQEYINAFREYIIKLREKSQRRI